MRVSAVNPNDLVLIEAEEFVFIGDQLAEEGLLYRPLSMIDFIVQYDSLKKALKSAASKAKRGSYPLTQTAFSKTSASPAVAPALI